MRRKAGERTDLGSEDMFVKLRFGCECDDSMCVGVVGEKPLKAASL